MSGQCGYAGRFILLGTGSSGGVPRIGNEWGACDPLEPRNRRTRCSALVERVDPAGNGVTRILIDTAPDMREQLLRHAIGHVDAVLFTHDHAYQSHGIDDLRQLSMLAGRRIVVHMDEETASSLTKRFDYCFFGRDSYPAVLDGRADLVPGHPISVSGAGGVISVLPIQLDHGFCGSLGFRFGDLAYVNDVVEIPEAGFAALTGVRSVILDALRYRPHPTHAHVEKALGWARRIGATHTVLTNLHVDLDYQTLLSELPDGIEPGYDGMELAFEGEPA